MKKYSANFIGIVALTLAGFAYSTAGFFDRTLSEEVSSFLQLTVRTCFSVLIFVVLMFFTKEKFKKIDRSDIKYFVQQAIATCGGLLFFILAVTKLQIGTTLFLFYVAVLLSGFLYGFFKFGEKLTQLKIISLVLSLIGLVIMYFDKDLQLNLIGGVYAIIAGASFSLNFAVSKNVSGKYPPFQINLLQFFGAFLISLPFPFFSGSFSLNFPINIWTTFFIYSLVVSLAYILSLYGYKVVETQKASIILLCEVVFGIIVGFLIYREIPEPKTIIGGILIFSALVISNLKFEKKNLFEVVRN